MLRSTAPSNERPPPRAGHTLAADETPRESTWRDQAEPMQPTSLLSSCSRRWRSLAVVTAVGLDADDRTSTRSCPASAERPTSSATESDFIRVVRPARAVT